MRRTARTRSCVVAIGIAVPLTALAAAWGPAVAHATTLPPDFRESTVVAPLAQATSFKFAPDGRVFVAEKSGLIKVFDSVSDTTPATFADLRTQVHDYWDRGLLGLVLDPSFPAKPYVYVYYVYNAAIGGTAPRWPTIDGTSDDCPTPPGPTDNGCVVSGRVSRLQAAGNVMTGSEKVLVEDWCQQFPSHSGGGMGFGADGALYVSGGEGAAFNKTDWGQYGDPLNPCGDPPGGVGATLSPPTTEGGRLRAQDLRTSGDPVGLSGSLIRIDPNTGAGLPDNPLASSSDANARRILAYGLRNPFRLAIRPETNDVFVADVGEGRWEEVDRVADFRAPVENFGWPCYQGGADSSGAFVPVVNPSFDSLNVNICEDLYREPGGSAAPYFAYAHDVPIVSDENCTTGAGNSITGIAFAPPGTGYPAPYRDAMFFSDYARNCIWVMYAGTNGLPDPSRVQLFARDALDGVDLEIGPGGDLFYLDYGSPSYIKRISYAGTGNRAPVAVASANPTNGVAPLTVSFDASGSSDPDGNALTYAWDLDGDGAFDDSTAQKPSFTYTQAGTYTAQLKVTDTSGASDTATIVISAGNTPPAPTIDYPISSMTWSVGQRFTFSGSAGDQQDGALPATSLSWSLTLHHCSATGCHLHPLQDFSGTASGSFTAPDHEWPSKLELTLTATDSGGLQATKTVLLEPRTTVLVFDSSPRGMQVTVGSDQATTPFARTVIVGSTNSVTAPAQTKDGAPYAFSSWSDGGAQSHDVVAGVQPRTYTAAFAPDTTGGPKTLTFGAQADARVEEANPALNFGTSTRLRSEGGSDPDMDSHLRFQVSGVTGAVTNAKVRLWVTDGSVNGPAVYSTGNAWSEAGVTWDNAPFVSSGPTDDKAAIDPGTWVDYDVTSLIAGDGPANFVLASDSSDGVDFSSREATDASHRPELLVTFGPSSGDFVPPNAPGALAAATPSGNVVDLAWTAATDNVGVTGYRVYRGGTLIATTGPATTYSDTSAVPGTTYGYQVTALDAAGHESPPSNTVTVATPHTTALRIRPDADARVEEANSATNFGTSIRLRVEGGTDPAIESYLRYRVSGVTAPLQSAKLRLWVTEATVNGPAAYTTPDNSWLETQITWANRPARTTTPTDDKGAITAGTWVQYDVKPLMAADGTYSFVLATGSPDAVNFASRDSGDLSQRPELALVFGNP